MNDNQTNRQSRLPLFVAFGLVLALAALIAGIQIGLQANRVPELKATILYPQPRELTGFTLVDGAGDDYGIERWHGQWRLVFFGFTNCPDICPSTLAMLRGVVRALPADRRPKVTFVSVDPERDKPEAIGEYARYFDPEFEAVTGDHQQLTALTRQMGVVYRIEPHESGDTQYGVDHSSAILLVDTEARLRGALTAPHIPEALIADLTTLLGAR
jgi:protein SCO1/2